MSAWWWISDRCKKFLGRIIRNKCHDNLWFWYIAGPPFRFSFLSFFNLLRSFTFRFFFTLRYWRWSLLTNFALQSQQHRINPKRYIDPRTVINTIINTATTTNMPNAKRRWRMKETNNFQSFQMFVCFFFRFVIVGNHPFCSFAKPTIMSILLPLAYFFFFLFHSNLFYSQNWLWSFEL